MSGKPLEKGSSYEDTADKSIARFKNWKEEIDGDRRDIIKVKLGDHAVRGGDLGFEFKNIEKAREEGLRLDEVLIRDGEMKEENMVGILE